MARLGALQYATAERQITVGHLAMADQNLHVSTLGKILTVAKCLQYQRLSH